MLMEQIKRILTGMLLLSFVLSTYASSELVIGEGVTESRAPINYYYLNTYQGCQMIFTADELAEMGDEAIINGFYVNYENTSSSAAPTATFEIRVGTTTSSNFGSGSSNLIDKRSMTLVSSSTTIGGWKSYSNDWVYISLGNFHYKKGSNIVIDIRNTDKSTKTNSSVYFTATTAPDYRTASWTGQSGYAYVDTGTRAKLRPNVRFSYQTYSSLTGETDFLIINCPQAGSLSNVIPDQYFNKLKITGEINNQDIYQLLYYCEERTYLNYLDLSDATIVESNDYHGTSANEIFIQSEHLSTIVLPDNCQSFHGSCYFVYTRSSTPCNLEINKTNPELYTPSGSKSAWRNKVANDIIVIDTPVRTISNAEDIKRLTQQEINSIDKLIINCPIDASHFRIISQMKELEYLTMDDQTGRTEHGYIVSYSGTEGTNYGTYEIYNEGVIPNNTFKGNTSLRYVCLAGNKIGDYCFQNATNLQKYKFAYERSGVKTPAAYEVGNYAFDGCCNLKGEVFGCWNSVGDFAFRNTQISSIALDHCCSDDDGFYDYVADGYYAPITHFGKNPLFGCPRPTKYYKQHYLINDGTYTSVESSTPHTHYISFHFEGSYEDSYLSLDDTLLGYSTTLSRTIVSLNFPIIADWAVCDLDNTKRIELGNKIKSIGEAFLYRCPKLSEITSSSTSYTAIDNVLFNSDCTTLLKYPSAREGKSYKIPATVTQLAKWSFESMKNLTDLSVCSSTPIELEDGVFEDTDLSKMTLHVPFGTRDAYAAADGWKEFGTIVEGNSITHVEMTDKSDVHDSFDISKNEELTIMDEWKQVTISDDIDNISVNYSRTYKNTNWQAWYVPFELELTSELMDRFSFAKFAGTYTDGGVFYITVIAMDAGEKLKANTPYFIKAKTANTAVPQVISIDNAVLHKTEETGFAMYSAEKKIDIRGIYSIKEATENDKDWYAYSAGKYSPPVVGTKLNPFRFYLTITDREDNPYAMPTSKPTEVRLMIIGDGEADDIKDIESISNDEFYNLNGQKISVPSHGIYLKNGKKVFIK